MNCSLNPLQMVFRAAALIDKHVARTAPWRLVAESTALAVLGTFFLLRYLRRKEWNLEFQVKSLMLLVPYVNRKVEGELAKLEASLEEKYFKGIRPEDVCKRIPEQGWEVGRILQRLEEVAGQARNGKNTGAYYIDNEQLDQLILEVCRLARRTNPLHADLSPLVRQLEAEIVRMTAAMFKGDDRVCGNVTSGGTDSIRHAVFTARERAKAQGLGADWEMVVPETAHPAFSKAANEYCVKLKKAKVFPQGHPKAFEVDVDSMRQKISGQTILVVGSMPPFPHGVPDNIEEISDMLQTIDSKGRIGLHVDGCLGGFVIPWMERAGYGKLLKSCFGFDVPRVTSVSADTHKYGYAEKGTSVVLYRDFENWGKHQVFVERNWQGGMYATPTLAGSRSGREIAATWAVMAYMGERGYVEETRKIIETTQKVANALRENSFLRENFELLGEPCAMVVAFASRNPDRLNIYDLKKELSQKGWYLSGLQKPAGLHLCVTAVHGNNPKFADEFIQDLNLCAAAVLEYPAEKRGKSGDAAMYCTNEKFGESIFIEDLAKEYWNISGRVEPLARQVAKV